MTARVLARNVAQAVTSTSFFRPTIGPLYKRYFDSVSGRARLFYGLYDDVAAAGRDIPAGHDVGYDNPASAARVSDEWMQIYEYDYPVMFWLRTLMEPNTVVFDWGGNIGLKYFAYRPYLAYAPTFRWIVCDVPAVAAAGREIAARENATGLRFSSSFEDLPNADILLVAGALHLIDEPFDHLRKAAKLPRHLVLAKVPVYDLPDAVTLNNMGTAICYYRLFNHEALVRRFEAFGYRLVDHWRNSDGRCRIPFYPKHTIDAYSGFYFELAS